MFVQAMGFQRWRRLVFLHWPLPPDALRPLVPRQLPLDLFQDQAYIGLIAFEVQELRAPFGPQALRLRFLETNVRTYVRLAGGPPSVYFFSLDAASLLAVLGARIGLGLPYFWATGAEHARASGASYALHRRTSRRPGVRLSFDIGESIGAAQPGTLEHFLVERYALHVIRGRTLWTIRVAHPPYPLQRATVLTLKEELLAAARVARPAQEPHVVYAPGVDVLVFSPRIGRLYPGHF